MANISWHFSARMRYGKTVDKFSCNPDTQKLSLFTNTCKWTVIQRAIQSKDKVSILVVNLEAVV